MLTTKDKEKLVEKYKIHDKDSGSPEVQVAFITEEIKRLLSHLKKTSQGLSLKKEDF